MASNEGKKDTIIDDNNVEETEPNNIDENETAIEPEQNENNEVVAEASSIMDVLAQIKDEQASIRAQLISMKDNISQFIDAGGVIREEDNIPSIEDDTDIEQYTPIEELDLNI